MPFKINISQNGKTWKLEIESEALIGKSLGDKISGKLIKPELEGYELEITGGSDLAGFPMAKNIEGIALKRVLLKKGWGMHDKQKGLRLRKSVRGKTISEKTIQINCNVLKEGSKKLAEIFPDQNKASESKEAENKTEQKTQEQQEKPAEDTEKPTENTTERTGF